MRRPAQRPLFKGITMIEEWKDETIDVGSAISTITFKQYPNNWDLLALLSQENDNIIFDLSFGGNVNTRRRSSVSPLSIHEELGFNKRHIVAAHLETDCFIDYSELYDWSGLEQLYLHISNPDVDYYDDNELGNFRMALVNLAADKLKHVYCDISACTDTAQEQIKSLLKTLDNQPKIEFIEQRARRKGGKLSR